MGQMVNGRYYTDEELRAIRRHVNDDTEFEKFLISGMIGAVTGSALLGGLLGGDFVGSAIGSFLDDLF